MAARNLVLLMLGAAASAGCSNATATTLDPSSDVHCSVLAFYFAGLAEHNRAPADQRHATRVMHEWYSAKIRAVAVERWGDMDGMSGEIRPLLEEVKRAPGDMLDELGKCADRAGADPAFDAFVRRHSRT